MNTLTRIWTGGIPGYCEGLPGGAFIFNLPGLGVDTQLGRRSLPGANTSASYCRIAADGYHIVCQGQEDDRAWLWDFDIWIKKALPAFGPNACIFDANDQPRIISGPPAVGYRYVALDGILVTCEATYADPARGLYEWTEWPDVAIGQGGKPDQGAVVRFADEGFLRRFSLGTIRNIRVRREGDALAIGMCNFDSRVATITWCSLAELRALLPVGMVRPDPPITVIVNDTPPSPPPTNPQPKEPSVPTKTRDQIRADNTALIEFYMAPEGLNRRARGQAPPIEFHDRGIEDWFFLLQTQSLAEVLRQIRTFDEYKDQHANDPRPQ